MTGSRYLCSQLVRLCAGSREQWVNLEEIWQDGAVLECEESVEPMADVTIASGEVVFDGQARATERHEFGWRVEIAFSRLTPWSIDVWKPEHAIDPANLGDDL